MYIYIYIIGNRNPIDKASKSYEGGSRITLYQIYKEGTNVASRFWFKGKALGSPRKV